MSNKEIFPLKSLAPTNNVDNSVLFNALDFAMSQDDIKTVALSGPYGSGKSSVLKSYEKRKNKNYHPLYVSLSKFKSNDFYGAEYSEKQIERDIIQQIVYHESPTHLPLSRISRIRNLGSWRYYLAIIPFICLILLLIEAKKPDFINPETINLFFVDIPVTCNVIYWSRIIALVICFLASVPLLRNFVLLVKRTRIKKFCISSTSIELDPKEESPINTYVDELLYFFEVTKYNVVVFEDIDRFNNIEIFVRLKQLNVLINNYANVGISFIHNCAVVRMLKRIFFFGWMKKIGDLLERFVESRVKKRTVKFLYAIKDDVFGEYERPKYFDIIIPVIPVIDRYNAGEKLRDAVDELKENVRKQFELPKEEKVFEKISNSFLYDVGLFINDMRLLKNIVNEFYVYDRIINKSFYAKRNEGSKPFCMDQSKLFAMIVFKNLCPQEFDDLEKDKGIVWSIFRNPQNIWKDGGDISLRNIQDRNFDSDEKRDLESRIIDLYHAKQKRGQLQSNSELKESQKRGIDFVIWAIENRYIDEDYNEYISIFYEGQLDENGHAFLMSIKQNIPLGFNFSLLINDEKNSCIVERINQNDAIDEWNCAAILNASFWEYFVEYKFDSVPYGKGKLLSMINAMYSNDNLCTNDKEKFFPLIVEKFNNEKIKERVLNEMANACESKNFIETFFLDSSSDLFFDFINNLGEGKGKSIQDFFADHPSQVDNFIDRFSDEKNKIVEKLTYLHVQLNLSRHVIEILGLDNVINNKLFTLTKSSLDQILLSFGKDISSDNYLTTCRSIENEAFRKFINDNLNAVIALIAKGNRFKESRETLEYVFGASDEFVQKNTKELLFDHLTPCWSTLIPYYESFGFNSKVISTLENDENDFVDLSNRNSSVKKDFQQCMNHRRSVMEAFFEDVYLCNSFDYEISYDRIIPFFAEYISVSNLINDRFVKKVMLLCEGDSIDDYKLNAILSTIIDEHSPCLRTISFMQILGYKEEIFEDILDESPESLDRNDLIYLLEYTDYDLETTKRFLLEKYPESLQEEEDLAYARAVIETHFSKPLGFCNIEFIIRSLLEESRNAALKFVYLQYDAVMQDKEIAKPKIREWLKVIDLSRANIYKEISEKDPEFKILGVNEQRHKWTRKEDYICCLECIKKCVIDKKQTSLSEMVSRLSELLPNIKQSSLEWKIRNIRTIFAELNVRNTLNISSVRTNYTTQNMDVMKEVLKLYGIPFGRKKDVELMDDLNEWLSQDQKKH